MRAHMAFAVRSLLSLAFVIPLSLRAQDPPMEWGNIPREDLEMKSFNADTSISAMVLGSYGVATLNDEFGFDYTIHVRIKIFSQAGYEYGTDIVSLYSKDYAEKLDDIEGMTYSLGENGKVVKTKLEDGMVFKEDVDKDFTRHRFTLPALKPGCVIEYQYKVIQKSMFYVRTWHFQKPIPVRWSEFRVIAPTAIAYARYVKGFESFVVNQDSEVVQHYSGLTSTYLGSSLVRCNQYRWAMRDIPALTEEPFVTTMKDYSSSIDMQLSEYALRGSGSTKVLKTWPALIEELLKDIEFGRIAEPNGRTRDIAAKITMGKTTPLEKLVALYDYVRKNIVWNGKRRFYGEGTNDDIIDSKSGNSGSINLTLVALLRSIGIDAHPVILSTRSNGLITEDYPIVTQFNATAVRASASGSDYVLEATDPARLYDFIPTSMLNVRGLVVKEGPVEWITLTSPKRYVQRAAATLSVDTTGEVHGTLESADLEYSALSKRKDLAEKKPVDAARSVFSTEKSGLNIDSASVTAPDSVNAAFNITAGISAPSYAQVAGDFIYINPAVIDRATSSPFKHKVRKFPVDMSYKRSITRVTNLTIPAGYEVKDLPQPVALTIGFDDGKYERRAALDGNVIQVLMRQSINTSLFQPRFYTSLKDFYERIVAAESDQIVLKKIPAPPPVKSSAGAASKSVKAVKPARK